jgi:hypothetical protein
MSKKRCEDCGKLFVPLYYNHTRFCSKKCRYHSRLKRKTCIVCGALFIRTSKCQPRISCSSECQRIQLSSIKKKNDLNRREAYRRWYHKTIEVRRARDRERQKDPIRRAKRIAYLLENADKLKLQQRERYQRQRAGYLAAKQLGLVD